jgi:hypothetical protein
MQIIDNFLPIDQFKQVEYHFLTDTELPWYFNASAVPETYVNEDEPFQFVHRLYRWFQPTSKYYGLMKPFLDIIQPHGLIRIKANLTTRTENLVVNGYHIDHTFDHKVGIFYVNSNNGYTLFESGDKVESVANRMLLFDGNLRHSGTNCTDQQRRVVINFNYLK